MVLRGSNGSPYNENSWIYEGWNGSPYEGNPWTGDSSGGGTGFDGNPWSNDGHNGNPWGNLGGKLDTIGSSLTNGTIGDSANSMVQQEYFYDTDEWKVSHFYYDSMLRGTANLIQDTFDEGFDHIKTGQHFSGLVMNSIKMQVGDSDLYDVYDMNDTSLSATEDIAKLQKFRESAFGYQGSTQASTQASNLSKFSQYKDIIKDSSKKVWESGLNPKATWGSMTALAKFNFVGSGINAGIAAHKTGVSIGNAIESFQTNGNSPESWGAFGEAGANLGETLMSAGGVTAAIPGGQAVGAGLAVVGAGLFVVGKGTQLVTKHWDKISSGYKKAKDTVKKVGKKVLDTIGGWFL